MKRMLGITTVAFALSCGGGGGGDDDTVWKEVTRPYDPDCKGCIELGEGALGHMEGVTILIDPEIDDEPAQWNMCVSSILYCIEDGGDKDNCVRDSECPGPCKDDYRDRAGDDKEAKWAAMETVFMDPESRCGPPAVEGRPQ